METPLLLPHLDRPTPPRIYRELPPAPAPAPPPPPPPPPPPATEETPAPVQLGTRRALLAPATTQPQPVYNPIASLQASATTSIDTAVITIPNSSTDPKGQKVLEFFVMVTGHNAAADPDALWIKEPTQFKLKPTAAAALARAYAALERMCEPRQLQSRLPSRSDFLLGEGLVATYPRARATFSELVASSIWVARSKQPAQYMTAAQHRATHNNDVLLALGVLRDLTLLGPRQLPRPTVIERVGFWP